MQSPAAPIPSNLSEEEYRLCVRVAKLYYENNLTQEEIGERLGYSRIKINRVLRQAREAGILEIRIQSPPNYYFDLENDLALHYGLRDAVVVQDEEPGQSLYLSLARGAAAWLKQHLAKGLRVGMGLGRTVSHLPQVFQSDKKIDCTFTEIVGAASEYSGGFASYNITSKMAELVGGKAEFFYAPTFVADPELNQKLLEEPSVAAALEKARSADIILQSVGPVDETALLYVHEHITAADLEDLRRLGAVGDALGQYYDRDGRHVPSFTDDCIIGIRLGDLTEVPWSVLIAGGPEKIIPIDAGLKGNYFNVLITDQQTGQQLLDLY